MASFVVAREGLLGWLTTISVLWSSAVIVRKARISAAPRAIRAAYRMGYKVHVYMKRPPSHVAIDVGEAELSVRPTLVQQVSFEHEGKVETGLIERIDPSDWENLGVVPKVYVVLNPVE